MTVGPVFTPGFTVRGRCKIQMLSCSSAATLDTWPSVHPFGILGHDGSTANLGTSRLEPERASALVECVPETTNAAIKPTPAQTNSIRSIFMRWFPPFTLTTLFRDHLQVLRSQLHDAVVFGDSARDRHDFGHVRPDFRVIVGHQAACELIDCPVVRQQPNGLAFPPGTGHRAFSPLLASRSNRLVIHAAVLARLGIVTKQVYDLARDGLSGFSLATYGTRQGYQNNNAQDAKNYRIKCSHAQCSPNKKSRLSLFKAAAARRNSPDFG